MRLYKYYSIVGKKRGYFLDCIGNSRLYLASPIEFNDPFDCDVPYHLTYGGLRKLQALALIDYRYIGKVTPGKSVRDYLNDPKKRDSDIVENQEFNESIRKSTLAGTLYRARITSFCAGEVRGTDEEILMWSHYGDRHRGICLEFDFDPSLRWLHPVSYYAQRPSFEALFESDPSFVKSMTTKSLVWKYEHEYRIIRDRDDVHYPFRKESLKGIYFGAKASDTDIQEMTSNVRRHGYRKISLYKMVPSQFDFKLGQRLVTRII
jgi:hypothetical protein